jgi:predicted small lipoprotein YifL
MVVLAIGLTGCGRKAALDPPPGPAVTDDAGAPAPASAPAPKEPGKPFFLDWLL